MFLDGQKLRPYIPVAETMGFTGAVDKQFIMNRLQEAAEAGECELYLEVVDLTYDLHDYNAYDFQDVIDELEHEGFDVEHDSHPMSYTIKF